MIFENQETSFSPGSTTMDWISCSKQGNVATKGRLKCFPSFHHTPCHVVSSSSGKRELQIDVSGGRRGEGIASPYQRRWRRFWKFSWKTKITDNHSSSQCQWECQPGVRNANKEETPFALSLDFKEYSPLMKWLLSGLSVLEQITLGMGKPCWGMPALESVHTAAARESKKD